MKNEGENISLADLRLMMVEIILNMPDSKIIEFDEFIKSKLKDSHPAGASWN